VNVNDNVLLVDPDAVAPGAAGVALVLRVFFEVNDLFEDFYFLFENFDFLC
jgi:hypothetical protein